MEIFNLISGVCSIVGLFVSLFVASKVLKLSNSNNNNHGEIQQGDGIQKIAKDRAAFADHNSNATFNDYSGATINGEIDEFPVLTGKKYPIIVKEADKYNMGVAKSTCNLVKPENSNTLCFTVDFSKVTSQPEANRWIGYAISSLPMRDWRSFVEKDYILQFDYMATDTITELWIEITNKNANKKIHKAKLNLSEKDIRYRLQLNDFKKTIEDWKSVDEICFVFFPENCIGEQGSVFITDLSVQKN